MDFARETRGHTARAACGHTSSGAGSGQRVRQLAELLEASVRGHAAMRRCTLGGMAPNVRFPRRDRRRCGRPVADDRPAASGTGAPLPDSFSVMESGFRQQQRLGSTTSERTLKTVIGRHETLWAPNVSLLAGE